MSIHELASSPDLNLNHTHFYLETTATAYPFFLTCCKVLQHTAPPFSPSASQDSIVDMSDTVAIAPLPHYYAAIRMDPVSMAKDLGLDDVAVAEAEELAKRTKKYLVYMFQVSMHPRAP